jgi:LSD1 subclass zinc finger protein
LTANPSFPCASCGARLEFAPGTRSLKCPYCATLQEIPEAAAAATEAAVQELDYRSALASALGEENTHETLVVKCGSCGAESSFAPNVTADRCAFCGTPLVAQAQSKKAIRPRALLPFGVDRAQAASRFRAWVRGLWFAPNRLKHEAAGSRIDGVYLPFWTYDCATLTQYSGQRGDDYVERQPYTTTENGRSVQRVREVRRTRWTPASGRVSRDFDDVLVPASRSLPEKYVHALEPWDLEKLVPCSDGYLSGFRVESYALSLEQGFEAAQPIMEETIRALVCRDIGGDRQRIDSLHTSYRDLTFKHVLLPVWISAYRFRNKVYRFLVNARTGEVQGERPWSWIKISLAAIAALLLVVLLLAIFGEDASGATLRRGGSVFEDERRAGARGRAAAAVQLEPATAAGEPRVHAQAEVLQAAASRRGETVQQADAGGVVAPALREARAAVRRLPQVERAREHVRDGALAAKRQRRDLPA